MDFFEKIVVSMASGILSSSITLFFTDKFTATNMILMGGSMFVILGISLVISKKNKKETEKWKNYFYF